MYMLGPDGFFWLAAPLSVLPAGLFGYVGLGPGQEFIPQFVALLSFAATALLAVLQWPITALLSRLSRARKEARKKQASTGEQPPAP
jgi:hypothetical protein